MEFNSYIFSFLYALQFGIGIAFTPSESYKTNSSQFPNFHVKINAIMTFWMLNNGPNVKMSRKFAKKYSKHFTSWNNMLKFKRIFAKGDIAKSD